MRYLRTLSPLAEIPLKLNTSFEWYLDGNIAPQTKTGKAYEELKASGINIRSIWHRNPDSLSLVDKALRIIFRLPLVLGLIIHRRKTIKKLDLAGIQVLIGYAAYKRFFKFYPRLKPIIISDISPFLHMQWAGALAAGNEVMWWQDDYHHYKGFSKENYLPYPCHYAVVLSEDGLKTAKEKCVEKKIFQRKRTLVKPLRSIPENPKVGFASNVLFLADEKQLKYIDKIRHKLGATYIYCRLHPNSKLHGRTDHPNWLNFAAKEETIEEFANEIDLVIVGNSAVQLKLLCLGIPVVHVEGFDGFGFDLYKYCKLGFSYGAKNLNALDITDIQAFYNDRSFVPKIYNYVNVTVDLPSLEELTKHIKWGIN